jgi:hypothetical protein
MHIKVLTFFSVLGGALLAGLVYSTQVIGYDIFFLLFVGFSIIIAFLLIYLERIEHKGLPKRPEAEDMYKEEPEEADATFDADEEEAAEEDEDLADDPELELEEEPAPKTKKK